MNKPLFLEELEKQLRPEERIFKFRTAELRDTFFKLSLLVDHNAYDDILDNSLKAKVLEITKKILPKSLSVEIGYIKANSEEDAIIKHIMEFVYNERPTIYSGFSTAKIEIETNRDFTSIRITLEKYLYEYALNSAMKEEMEKYLDGYIMEEVEVEFVPVPNKEDNVIVSRSVAPKSTSIATINVNISEYITGKIAHEPRYISDFAKKEADDVVLCGTLSNIKARFIEKIQKYIYSFYLNDTTGTIKVKFFAKPYIPEEELTVADRAIIEHEKKAEASGKRKSKQRYNINWEQIFTDGAVLVMSGPIKYDDFDKTNVFMPRNIAKCSIDYSSINLKKDYRPAPENYVNVFPQPIEVARQNTLFDTRENPELKKHVFVVFDLETTGLEPTSDRIIEIAAIKIIDGEMRESFDCLINPGIVIPQKIVELTNITNEMVANSYKISDVIGDFYKFTRGAIMVAHNASFDMGFISVAGKNNFYDFDNGFADTLAMSRQTLTTLRHHNLESVCKQLNISLVGAHRAINDTLATAKVFIELMNRQKF